MINKHHLKVRIGANFYGAFFVILKLKVIQPDSALISSNKGCREWLGSALNNRACVRWLAFNKDLHPRWSMKILRRFYRDPKTFA